MLWGNRIALSGLLTGNKKKVIPLPQPHEQQLLFYSSRGGSKLSFLVVTFVS